MEEEEGGQRDVEDTTTWAGGLSCRQAVEGSCLSAGELLPEPGMPGGDGRYNRVLRCGCGLGGLGEIWRVVDVDDGCLWVKYCWEGMMREERLRESEAFLGTGRNRCGVDVLGTREWLILQGSGDERGRGVLQVGKMPGPGEGSALLDCLGRSHLWEGTVEAAAVGSH